MKLKEDQITAAPSPLPERDVRSYGPNIACGQLFYEQAVNIYNETGIDLFRGQSPRDLSGLPKQDWKVRHRSKHVKAIKRGAPRHGGTWEGIEVPSPSGRSVCRFERRTVEGEVVELRALIDVPYRHSVKVKEELTEEELYKKRVYQAAVARTSRAAYREDDRSDAPRFGYCKRKDCVNHKVRSLVRRSLCPDCLQKPEEAASTKPTVIERRKRVLGARQAHPEASERELAKVTGLPKTTVRRFLKEVEAAA